MCPSSQVTASFFLRRSLIRARDGTKQPELRSRVTSQRGNTSHLTWFLTSTVTKSVYGAEHVSFIAGKMATHDQIKGLYERVWTPEGGGGISEPVDGPGEGRTCQPINTLPDC